ncbi:MAG: SRPBCC domain-containing protein [Enhydrobacter sp.]
MSREAQFTHAHMTRFERPLPASREKIWALLTTPALLPGWYGAGRIEGYVGGQVHLMGGHIKGVVTQWVPQKRLAYTWNVFMPGQAVSGYPESYLTLELDDAKLVLTHLPVLDDFVKLNAMGWHTFLDMLEAAARGETVEPREAYMKRSAAVYGVKLPS